MIPPRSDDRNPPDDALAAGVGSSTMALEAEATLGTAGVAEITI
jgi:hypothetical protein